MAKVGEPHDSNCMVRAHNEWPCTCGADELEIECRCRCGHTLDQHAQSEWEKIKPALVCTVCLCAEFMGGGRLNGRAPDCNSGVVTPQAGSIPARRTNSLSDGIWIMLCGGHGAGKTTLLQSIRKERPPSEVYHYVFADSGGAERDEAGKIIRGSGKLHDKYKAPKEIQFPAIQTDWDGPVPVVISDGTRIQTAIKNAHLNAQRKRKLAAVVLFQTPEVMEAHMRARCLAYGKEFNAKYWTKKALYDTGRVEWERFFKSYPLPVKLYTFQMDLEFAIMPQVKQLVLGLMAEGKWLALETLD